MSAHDESGDYGYDLAHEIRTALSTPVRRRAARPVAGPFGPESDVDGDFGYDQAHER